MVIFNEIQTQKQSVSAIPQKAFSNSIIQNRTFSSSHAAYASELFLMNSWFQEATSAKLLRG